MNHHRFGSVRFGFGLVLVFWFLVWFGLDEMKFSDVADDCMPWKPEDRRQATEDGRTENPNTKNRGQRRHKTNLKNAQKADDDRGWKRIETVRNEKR